jgi:hypothetical protein
MIFNDQVMKSNSRSGGCIPREAADGASAAPWPRHIQDIVIIVIKAVVAVVVVVVAVMVVDEPLLHMSRLGPVLRRQQPLAGCIPLLP